MPDEHPYGEVPYSEAPYGAPIPDGGEGEISQPFNDAPFDIPGRIPAAEFDRGGEGVAYHETTEPAPWAVDYRSETNVDVKSAPDGEKTEYAIGRFGAAEWLRYTVSVEPGVYKLRARVATAHDGRQLAVMLGGQDFATVDVPNRGWGTYATVETEVDIGGDAGERVLELSPTADGVDVAWLEFIAAGSEPEPEPTPKTTIRVDIGGTTETVVVFGASPSDVSVTDGTVADPTVMLGALPTTEDLSNTQ